MYMVELVAWNGDKEHGHKCWARDGSGQLWLVTLLSTRDAEVCRYGRQVDFVPTQDGQYVALPACGQLRLFFG